MKNIFALFRERDNADRAIQKLHDDGYGNERISVMMRDPSTTETLVTTKVEDDVARGAVTGGVVGAVAGLLIGASIIALPGVGALAVAGPLAASLGISTAAASTLTGAAAGALGGGVIGALVNLGLPEEQAKMYEQTLTEKGVVIVTNPRDGDTQKVVETMTQNGAISVTAV